MTVALGDQPCAATTFWTAIRRPSIFGEDVARKGGVYGVTRGLLNRTSSARVFDTLLDEQSILGLALGAGVSGLLPIPEIQYLAYLHNAADQIRGEGATLQFFSNRQYRNPMVVRVAGYGYQKGFGGHFHNDNSIAAIRDIPGVVIASPAAARRRRGDVAHLCRRGEDGGRGLHLPRAHRPVPHARSVRGRRRAVARDLSRRRRADRSGPNVRRRNGFDDPHVRQRATHEPARCPQTRIVWHRRPRRRPAMAGAAAGRGHAPRSGHHRARRSSSTKPEKPGEWAKASSPRCSNTATPAPWTGSPAGTASSRWVTPRCRCCCRRRRLRPQP